MSALEEYFNTDMKTINVQNQSKKETYETIAAMIQK